MTVIYVTRLSTNLSARLLTAYIETIARSQKETGGYCGHGAEHPEQEEANAISTNSADVVFDKHNAWIKGSEEQDGSDARGNEGGPENSYNTLNDRDFVHATIYYLKMRLCHYVCSRIYCGEEDPLVAETATLASLVGCAVRTALCLSHSSIMVRMAHPTKTALHPFAVARDEWRHCLPRHSLLVPALLTV